MGRLLYSSSFGCLPFFYRGQNLVPEPYCLTKLWPFWPFFICCFHYYEFLAMNLSVIRVMIWSFMTEYESGFNFINSQPPKWNHVVF